jgi:hypothetical protein
VFQYLEDLNNQVGVNCRMNVINALSGNYMSILFQLTIWLNHYSFLLILQKLQNHSKNADHSHIFIFKFYIDLYNKARKNSQ